jgi:hypothetical protein
MTAPIASGWSVCQVGLAPTGKRRLVTAHTPSRHSDRGVPPLNTVRAIVPAIGDYLFAPIFCLV